MEDLRKELDQLIEKELLVQELSNRQQISTRNSVSNSIIREESLQNSQISDSKDHQESIRQLVRECRLDYLKKLQSHFNTQQEKGEEFRQYLKNFQNNFGYLGSEQNQYVWQLIQSLEALKSVQSGLTFLSDKNSFLNGGLVYSLLKDAFSLYYGMNVVNIFQSQTAEDKRSQLQIDEQVMEKIWNNVVVNGTNAKNNIYYFNLEYLTPTKIIFIARLQKHFENQNDAKQSPNIIIYSDDILSAQLKEQCHPQLEIVLELYRMPQKIIYSEDGELTQKSKIQKIESIIIDSLKRYKQTLMRFDILVFVKNIEEGKYLKEHHLNLIKEKLNIIDLTDVDVTDEEKPFFEEDFKKEWYEQLQIRKEKEKIEKARYEEEQRIKLQEEQLALEIEKKKQQEKELQEKQLQEQLNKEKIIMEQMALLEAEKERIELERQQQQNQQENGIPPNVQEQPIEQNIQINVEIEIPQQAQQEPVEQPQIDFPDEVIPVQQIVMLEQEVIIEEGQKEEQEIQVEVKKEEEPVPETEEQKKLREEEELKKKQEEEELRKKKEEEERQKELSQYEEDLNKHINRNKKNLYKNNEFNVFIIKNHKQLRYHTLDNIIIQIDTGEAYKVYFMDTNFESIPVVSSKITREEALKRERLMGISKSCEIYRLYERKEFLRLQKRDFLNLINLEQFKAYSEVINEKCPEKQALRILMQVMINLSENWFSCSSEVSAHVSILWSRMGDLFSIHNSLLLIPGESHSASTNLQLQNMLEKNQINSKLYDKICLEIQLIAQNLNLQIDPIKLLKGIDNNKFSELIQQIAIEKYWRNLCVYSGHRRLGFRHFESAKMINYAEVSSMNLIQERPFLILPLQLQINSKNQYEIKQCIAIDHPFLLENAPTQFIEKHKLRLLKRQSLNLHEIEYFGISDALFKYFEDNIQLIKDMESKYDCYYEPNHHMDTITIHCDASQKEKLEKLFSTYMQDAQKHLSEELMEVSHGNNCILKIQKGGTIKEVTILQNDHIFIVDNLPQTVKEQEIIDLFSEYGDILHIKFFTDPNVKHVEENSISAEVLVAETEDSTFFVETFNQIEFQGRTLQLRLKNHSYQIHQNNDSTLYHIIVRWQTWKSKLTGRIEFVDESSVSSFLKQVQNKLVIDGKEIKAEIDKIQNKVVLVSGLCKQTDEQTLKNSLIPELQKNVVSVFIDRIADVDRGISKASLIHQLKKVYNEQHQIDWVRRGDYGIVEAKISYAKNFLYKIHNIFARFNAKADILGLQKVYVEKNYTQTFNYEYKLMNVVQMILKGNQELVKMQQNNEIRIKEKVVRPIPSKQDFLIILRSNNEAEFNKAKGIIQAILSPKLLDLRNVKLDLASLFDEDDQVDYSQIFTEIGQKKLREIEKKYPVYFKINLIKEDVRVFCTDAIYELINKEVEYFLRQSVRVKIPISGKNIRNILGIDGKGLEEFKNKTQLCKIQLDYISKDVYMEGNSKQVDQAKNALLALLEEKNSSSCLNNMPYSYEDCQVCSNTIVTGYRLQGCGHKFCLSCIMFVIDNSLGDLNSLPIKCPFCSQAVIMRDIKALMCEEQLQKMNRMSLNHYVQNNFQEVSFCVNENCKSIHSSKLAKYTCYECNKTYCSKCSAEYHFGMTCTLYQETEAKNIEFLIKEGARKCPCCGVYIIRIDGCYRVECRRCSKHICWKDNCMNYYETSTECYNHLDEKHGGYW